MHQATVLARHESTQQEYDSSVQIQPHSQPSSEQLNKDVTKIQLNSMYLEHELLIIHLYDSKSGVLSLIMTSVNQSLEYRMELIRIKLGASSSSYLTSFLIYFAILQQEQLHLFNCHFSRTTREPG